MADEIKLKAPTVEQQVVVNINGEDKLKSFADTLDKISNNKNLQKYWKTQQDLINATADAYSNFQKKASKDNASELIKVTNALKAMSGTDLSHILPDFDKISKSMAEAQKAAGNIDSAFSVKGFKEAFDSFETLKAYGTDVQKLFSHFGVSSDIGELQQNVRLLEGEVEKLTRRLINAKNANDELRNEFENFKVGSGFADKLDELDRLKAEMQNIRDEATQTFNQFLDANKIDRYDWFSDDRFAEYFEKLENGTLTATDAIRRFKSEYSYLLEDSYKSNGDSFGLDQLQVFSTKLDSIFHQVEETSNKINDILSNGVIAKSVQNLSEDTTLSDSQRSIFGNILQDEESLKSITALFQKLIDETNQTKNTEVFNTEQFTKLESLFTSIESSLSSIKGVLVDVGDGEELSPLLKTITNVESGIDKLSSSVKGIGLNMNIDLGSDKEMEAKAEAKISNALQAYQRLFEHIKMSSAGGSIINTKFFDFDINQYDTTMSKLQAYRKFIENMRNEAKAMYGGQDVLFTDTDKKYWTQASSAMGQVTKTFNEMKAASDTNPLENIFGKTDLTEVLNQLSTIASKLDEISMSANRFADIFKDGLNVNASVEEIDKLTNRVKELESELEKIKTPTVATPQESNISSASTPAIEQQNKLQEELKETQQQAEKARQSISKLVESRDIVSQNWYREKGTVVSKDSKGNDITRDADEFSFVERLKNGQLQTVLATYNEETGKWAEQIINVRTAFEQVERAIISADNKIASLEMAKDKTLAAHPGYDATADDNQIALERKKRDELQATLNLYGSEKEYVFEIEAATKRIADNQERLNNKKQSQTNLRQAVFDEKDAKANEQANKRDAKQAQIEAENIKLAEQKTIYNELNDSLDRYLTVSKRTENGKALEGDYEEAAKLQEKIEELQNNPILSQEQLDASQRKLDKIETTLEDIATAKAKSDSVKVDSENVKNIQAEWGKNIKVIQDYMDAVTKLNNLKAKDKGTGSEANQIELQTQNVEKLKQVAFEARQNLSSMQAENPDIITWKQWVDMMELFDQASKGSAESAAKLKDVLDNIKVPSLDKYENKLASYQTKTGGYNATIARFKDGGWTSDTYKQRVNAVKEAVKQYADILNNFKKHPELVNDDELGKLDKQEKLIKDNIIAVQNMSAAEKGYSLVSGQKELDKINNILKEHSGMSREAKNQIKAYYTEIKSGNPSASLDVIHGKIMQIVNAEIEAGRGGKSMFDAIKEKAWYGVASAIGTYFGFNDLIRYGKEGVSIVRQLDTALTEMRKVSNESVQSLKKYQDTTFDTADAVGTTAKQIQNSTADWMRLGESMDTAAKSAKDANILLNVSEFEGIDEATESLVSMSQAYKDLDKMDIIDVLNNIGNNYSISTDGLATALKDSASALVTANNDLNEAVSLTTAGNAITQDPSKVGAGLRTISLRLVGTEEAKEELSDLGEETDGMITTVSKLRNTIQSATSAATKDGKGFDIFDSNGNYKSTYEIMQGLADLYDEIVKKDKELGTNNLNLLLETIAGKNRSNIAASILQNGDMLRSVYEDAQNSEGSAEKELNSYLDSVDGKFQQLQNRTQEFWYNVIDTTTVKSVLDFTTDLTEGASKFFKLVEKHLPTILGAIATIIASNKSGGLIRLINFINNSPFLATVEFNREVYELII